MGTTQRRQREAQQRRQEILQAAGRLFFRQGFERTTMPQIAEAAELAPGTLYLYFPSKDALYIELLCEGYDQLLAAMADATAAQAQPRQAAEALVNAFIVFACTKPQYFDIMLYVSHQMRKGGWGEKAPNAQLERLHTRESACKALAATVLASAGYNNADERILTVEAVWAMLSGLVFHFGNDANFPQLAQRGTQLILRALFDAS